MTSSSVHDHIDIERQVPSNVPTRSATPHKARPVGAVVEGDVTHAHFARAPGQVGVMTEVFGASRHAVEEDTGHAVPVDVPFDIVEDFRRGALV